MLEKFIFVLLFLDNKSNIHIVGTSFVYQGQFYQQLEGAAMATQPYSGQYIYGKVWRGSPGYSTTPTKFVERYVDDTFVIQEEPYKNDFFQHIKSVDDNIKFTAETTKADGSMPFLDTLVTPESDGSLETTVHRKPTHTNQYLQWDSHHTITNKYNIISTLLHRAKTSALTNIYWKKNKQIDRRPWQLANTLIGQ